MAAFFVRWGAKSIRVIGVISAISIIIFITLIIPIILNTQHNLPPSVILHKKTAPPKGGAVISNIM